MTESIQQMIIFSVVISVALVFVFLLVKNYTNKLQKDSSEAQQRASLLDAEVEQYRIQQSDLKESLAAANSSIEHFKQNELNHQASVQQLQNKLDEASRLAVELQGTKSQLEAKVSQIADLKTELARYTAQINEVNSTNIQLSRDNAELTEKASQLEQLKSELNQQRSALKDSEVQVSELRSQIAADEESKRSQLEKIELLERSEKRLTTEFENVANKIFKQKSGDITEQNKTSLDSLLTPLKEQIGHFTKQVNDVYTQEAKERHALAKEVTGLKELNIQMSKEATALTRALKGDNKKQGSWGEVVLERVLQKSGLRENQEYETQKNLKDEDGKSFKPDVIVHLPGNKDVVIDSKVALVAYERFYNAEDDAAKSIAIKQHVNAIKEHIKLLSAKNYQDLHGIQTLDYVLMFIPLEPAFYAALEEDSHLVEMALEKNIMLVSPTNLMVALKTINNMWRVELQNQNAQEIANKAGAIYDKLVGFVEDMQKLGRNLKTADSSYNDAMKKLSTGRGNLLSKADEMKQLRISSNKSLPESLLENDGISALTEIE